MRKTNNIKARNLRGSSVNPAKKDKSYPEEFSIVTIKLFRKPAGIMIATPMKKVFKIIPEGSGNLSDLTIYKSIASGDPTVKTSVKSNI